MNKKKIILKKFLLKFPFLYTKIHRIRKKLKGINLNEEGIAKEELKVLLGYMGRKKLVVEIGTFGGQTTRRLAENNNFVIAIDPFIPNSETGTLNGEYPHEVYLRFLKNIMNKKVMFFPLTSEEVFNLWDKFIKMKIDSIFVDGLHTYEGVKTDFRWTKYLKKKGVIAFHDTNIPGVKKFIDENVFKNPKYKCKFIGKTFTLKVFQKN